MKITTQNNISPIYCIIFLISIAFTILYFFIDHGSSFNNFFFKDSFDTGMDFFHSLEYVKGRTPYEKFNTLYPPLANLFFYCLFRFIPTWQHQYWENNFQASISARGTSSDLRVWQPTMILFILFIIISAVIFIQLVQIILEQTNFSFLTGLGLLFSYGMLFAFERGNIIIISLLSCMFFLHYRNSSNWFIKEIALLALAIATGLKIYPVFLGFLLLYDKKWKDVIHSLIYGIIMFIFPTLIFKEGISCLAKFIQILLNYSTHSLSDCKGVSLNKIFNSITYAFSIFFNIPLENTPFDQLPIICNLIFVLLLLLSGFILTKQWERILVCTLSIILIQTQPIYILTFMTLPLLYFIKEENLNSSTIVAFIALMGLHIPLPLSLETTSIYSMQFLRLQFFTTLLCIYVIYRIIKILYLKRRLYDYNCSKNLEFHH